MIFFKYFDIVFVHFVQLVFFCKMPHALDILKLRAGPVLDQCDGLKYIYIVEYHLTCIYHNK